MILQACPPAGRSREGMGAGLLRLLQRLLLLGTVAMTVSALETADLVDLCGQTWRGDALLLRSHSQSRRFYFVARDTDCGLWMWAAAPGDRILFQFRFFLVYSLASAARAPNASTPAPAEPCAPGSYLQFYEGPPGAPRALGTPLCGLTIPVAVTSSGPSLGLRLVTRGRQPRVDFVGEATSFRLGPCGAYFRCQNGRCIPPSLVCDHLGMDNCGDSSDQGSGPPAGCGGPSLAPSGMSSVDGDTSKPLTLSLALGSSGPLRTAAGRSPPMGREPAQQDAAVEGRQPWRQPSPTRPASRWAWAEEPPFPSAGPQSQGLALASTLLLASAGLLLGLLWCCCFWAWLTWQPGTCSLHLRHNMAGTSCCTCPGRVAPDGPSRPAFQDQGGHL